MTNKEALKELKERLDVSNRTGKEKVDGISKTAVKKAIECIKEIETLSEWVDEESKRSYFT